MTTFEKLSLKSLLSHIPEILNSNFSRLKTLIEKFYIDESDTVISHDMDVEGILQIGENLKTNNVYIRHNGSTISLYDILERIKNLENTSGGSDDPGNDPGNDPINPPIDPVDPVNPDDPSPGGEPDEDDPTERYNNCIHLAGYCNLLTDAYNKVVAYGYTGKAADEMLAKYCRQIKYNNAGARPGSDSFDDVYGSLDEAFVTYMQMNCQEFSEVEVVYLNNKNMYLDIIKFWAIVNGLMYNKGDFFGWGSDLIFLASVIDAGYNVTSIPLNLSDYNMTNVGFTELNLFTDFEGVQFYERYTNSNYPNIARAFNRIFLGYLGVGYEYDLVEYELIKTFTDLKDATDVETIYEESDSSELLEAFVNQLNISEEALTTAKGLLQNYIDKALLSDNTVSPEYFKSQVVNMMLSVVNDYIERTSSEQDNDMILIQYYRSINYNDQYWNTLYGTPDQGFADYIENFENYWDDDTFDVNRMLYVKTLKTIKYIKTKNNSLIDFSHFWAALEALFNTYKDLGGWAGDLVEYAQYIPTDNTQGIFPGKGFEHEDFCADFDAIYVYNHYNSSSNATSKLFGAINSLCTSIHNQNTQRDEDIQRVNSFIDYKGSSNIAQIYSSSESALPLAALKMQRQVTDENLNIAIGILQTHINNLIS